MSNALFYLRHLLLHKQEGCINDTSVPPMRQCWPQKTRIVDLAAEGADYDITRDMNTPNGLMFHLMNLTLFCDAVVDPKCLKEGEPLVCYLEARKKYLALRGGSQQQQQQQQHGDGDLTGTLLLVVAGLLAVAGWRRCRQQRRGKVYEDSDGEGARCGAIPCRGDDDTKDVEPRKAAAPVIKRDEQTGVTFGEDHELHAVRHQQKLSAPAAAGLKAGKGADLPAREKSLDGGGTPKDAPGKKEPSQLLAAMTDDEATEELMKIKAPKSGDAVVDGSSGTEPPTVELLPVVLGKGGFGRVVEGLYSGRRVAVKLLASDLLAACVTPPRLCLVMELMEASLERLMYGSTAETLMPLAKVLHISINVANALAYLHPTVVHRDLKMAYMRRCERVIVGLYACERPANVLMNNPACDRPVVKLSGHPNPSPHPTSECIRWVRQLSTSIQPNLADQRRINFWTLGCRGFELRLNPPKHLMLARDRSKDRKMLQPPYMPPECFDILSKHVTHQVVGLGVCLCVTNGLSEYVLSIIPGLMRCVRTCGNVTMCKEGVRKDIYSLGVLIWEMLAGKRPWEGVGNVAIAFMVTYKGLRLSLDDLPSSRCPAKLCRLLKACWESDPARRPAAAEVAKELTLVLEDARGQLVQLRLRHLQYHKAQLQSLLPQLESAFNDLRAKQHQVEELSQTLRVLSETMVPELDELQDQIRNCTAELERVVQRKRFQAAQRQQQQRRHGQSVGGMGGAEGRTALSGRRGLAVRFGRAGGGGGGGAPNRTRTGTTAEALEGSHFGPAGASRAESPQPIHAYNHYAAVGRRGSWGKAGAGEKSGIRTRSRQEARRVRNTRVSVSDKDKGFKISSDLHDGR
ncbi:hypothetical protein VOLCADRAFT_88026 [Volvox carteri f. nagariensis]|uniref:Protein kinase domain-containing protein n=1 Tax=Volvox carteri f. nagariensis TaxID=3068 RepID=D8TMV8_VOLCA|nr:uncharacterized protein VOLCADRAFT_88026 [Volvox carteri f. nagariensis]EFJ51194.1 hypothetical protein VOLCADRAFT_88026 [Volvox carteri f. nagariensis]|eukprot:XP_002947661.1 hypothetical protein VOLCADRAFT_88026 [Volvox carteri f. nagariensis]